MIRRFFTVMALLALATPLPAPARAALMPDMNLADFHDVASKHPAGEALKRLFPGGETKIPADFKPTGLTKKDYLRLIAGNVDYWKQHLSDAGAILDPHEKHEETGQPLEKQYSTPAFASAAALLVKEAGRDDLIEPASRAFEFALDALLNKTTANRHPDFYIPMLVHAWRILHERVPAERAAKWETMMKAIDPLEHYQDQTAGANWNIVNVAGEALRRKSGLVADHQKSAQQQYLTDMLTRQQRRFTKYGMYEDPGVPLAYDAFPRLWLEEIVADGAYEGPAKDQLERFLALGGLSSLLLISPSGEWPNGGRSAQHQWNEAATAVICEINALKWKKAGRADVAGSFKRAARMCLKSMFRWQRPSGEMWIVKNRAEPELRHGFEDYSFHSQYNLLPMAMLAIACTRADDSIEERPIPSEVGSYVFELGTPFTFVVAAAGGYYVLINTNADHHYDATGLQRVHRAGVELSPHSGSSGESGLAPGIQWKKGEEWIGVGHFHRRPPTPRGRPGEVPEERRTQRTVNAMHPLQEKVTADQVSFLVEHDLMDGTEPRWVARFYRISVDGVRCDERVMRDAESPKRFVLPVLVHDGANDTTVTPRRGGVDVVREGGALKFELLKPEGLTFQLLEPRVRTHNGYMRAAAASLPQGIQEVQWQITLEPAPRSR